MSFVESNTGPSFEPHEGAITNPHDPDSFSWHLFQYTKALLYNMNLGTKDLVVHPVKDPQGKTFHFMAIPFHAYLLTWKDKYDRHQRHIMIGKYPDQVTLLSRDHADWTRWIGNQLYWSRNAFDSAQKRGNFVESDPRDPFFPVVSHKRGSQVYLAYNVPLDGDKDVIDQINALEKNGNDVARIAFEPT